MDIFDYLLRILLLALLFLPAALLTIDFLLLLIRGKRLTRRYLGKVVEGIAVLGLPAFFILAFDWGQQNDCCNESAVFSPDHRLSIYILIGLCCVSFCYSTWRKRIAPPLLELFVNIFLLIGIALNIMLMLHIDDLFGLSDGKGDYLSLAGNLPVIMAFLLALENNHRQLMVQFRENPERFSHNMLFRFLTAHPLIKFPVLVAACLPVLALLACVLLLFGQKPDSFVRAFTDTYKHGFSQWDYMCENVSCGGHFLCSVAAKGHPAVVKPERLGIRGGALIICNRQLLVSNAFEELLEEKMPRLHRLVRRQYNKVGNMIHKHYGVFNRKGVADFVYVLMKPAEWIFLVVLYLSDRNPENRIARQYLPREDQNILKNKN